MFIQNIPRQWYRNFYEMLFEETNLFIVLSTKA